MIDFKRFVKALGILNSGDRTKQLQLEVADTATTNTKTTVQANQTANRTLMLPNATDTLVGKATADILTNKTIDADAVGNVITNIENENIKAMAGIDAAKIADGSVSNAEFQQLSGVTGAVVDTSSMQTLTNKTIDADLNTITNIDDNDIKALAAINATKIANGTVSNVEFQYLDGVLSPIQTQLDGKTTGPVSSIDNTVARFNGTAGAIQGSNVVIDDSDNVFIPGSLEINGNLTVQGTTTTLNTATLDVEDANVTVNKNGTDGSSEGAGVTVDRTGTKGSIIYSNAATSKFKLGDLASEVEIATISHTQTLTNKNLSDTTTAIVDAVDPTKRIAFDAAGTTGTTTTLLSTQTTNRTLTLPNITDTLVTRTNTETLTNKTLTSPQLNTPRTDVVAFDGQAATPANPAAGDFKIYVKDSTGLPYILNSAGLETEIGASGGGAGGINYIDNPDAEDDTVGWTTYNDTLLFAPADVNVAANTFTNTNYVLLNAYFYDGLPVVFTSTGTLPSPLVSGTTYYLRDKQPTTFALAATPGGAQIDITTQGTGTHRMASERPIAAVNLGGAPTVTYTRSTVNPLRDTASFLFTKDAANRQGEGVYYSFMIDNADQAKPLQIAFDYMVSTGTYSGGTPTTSSDLTVWIIDVTNQKIIQPAGIKLDSSSSTLSTKFQGLFQTDAVSTSYKLVIHNSTPNASAYVMQLDNFVVGPQTTSIGYAGSDWAPYAPTFQALSGFTILEAFWKRNGSNVDLKFKFSATASTAAEAQMSLPPGQTSAGTDIIPTISIAAGESAIATNAAAAVKPLMEPSKTYITFGLQTSGNSSLTKMTGTQFAAVAYSFFASVPIAGWSSNTIVSSDTDTRVVAARYTTNTGTTGGTIQYNTLDYDTHGAVTTGAAWKFTAPVPGIYEIASYVQTSGNIGQNALSLNRNNVGVQTVGREGAGGTVTAVTGVGSVRLNAGDFIHLTLGGTAVAITDAWVTIRRLSGASQIAATETVAAMAKTSTTSVATSETNIIFTSVVDDSHGGAYSTVTGFYTVPAPGRYSITTQLDPGGNMAANETLTARIQKNGVTISEGSEQAYSNNARVLPQAEAQFSAISGDIIRVVGIVTGAAARALSGANSNYFVITRIGN